jgi:hypothetical protein
MYMDGNSYETMMASLIHSAPKAADEIKALLIAYAKAEDFEPYLEPIDAKLHSTIRTMVHELNTIEDPEILDREIDRLLAVIDRLVQELNEAHTLPPNNEAVDEAPSAKPRAKKAKKKATGKTKKQTPAKKASKKPKSKAAKKAKTVKKSKAAKKAKTVKKTKTAKKAKASKPAKKAASKKSKLSKKPLKQATASAKQTRKAKK